MQTLSSDQLAHLAAAIVATAETLGQTISANAAQLMAEDLAEHPAEHVAAALRACRRELSGRLTLSAILERTQAADGRPGRDEAWSIAIAGSDEFETVVLTEEIQRAMSVADPILELGDKVGARMAFLSAYDRHVEEARRQKIPAKWSVSLGFDPDRRRQAIDKAVLSGLLPAPEAQKEISRLGFDSPISEDGKAIAGLLTGVAGKPSTNVREKLDEIRESMKAAREEKEAAKKAERTARLKAYEERRALQLAALAELQEHRQQRELAHD